MIDAPPAVQSWLRHDIFLGADEILALPQHERKTALARIPELVQPYVEDEVRRLWAMDRSLRQEAIG